MEEKLVILLLKQLICLLLKLASFFSLRGLIYRSLQLRILIRKNLVISWSALNTCGLALASSSAMAKFYSW
jgi:hypothetical protein